MRQHRFKIEQIDRAQELKKVVDSVDIHRLQNRPRALLTEKKEPRHSEGNICGKFANRVEYFWMVHVVPLLYTLLGVLFFLLTALVIFFEFSLYLSWDSNDGLSDAWQTFANKNSKASFLLANLICMVPLCYICAASYYGLFKIKVQSVYALHRNQQTDPACLVFSGMLLMRLALSVAYNFLELS